MCQPEIGHTLFLVANHFNSKSGDGPLFGFAQPPVLVSEIQRNQQAQIVNDFVDAILALDASANIVVLGDINDFQFSTPLAILKGGVLTDLITGRPARPSLSDGEAGRSRAAPDPRAHSHSVLCLGQSRGGGHAGVVARNLNRDRIESSRNDTRAL